MKRATTRRVRSVVRPLNCRIAEYEVHTCESRHAATVRTMSPNVACTKDETSEQRGSRRRLPTAECKSQNFDVIHYFFDPTRR